MTRRAGATPFYDLLPGSIRDDAGITAAAASLDPSRRALALGIPNVLLWARLEASLRARPTGLDDGCLSPALQRLTDLGGGLKPLTEAELELLAYQLHVDFRETATTREQLAAMVRNSIPWHRIKGTPASIKQALALFGYSGITIEEDGTGEYWAAYQLGLSGITGMDDLARIVTICRDMAPVRCRLWRVYTPEYDFRPGVWSGPLPTCAWSQCWWSEYSGVEAPDIPGLDDDHDLIVSFGSSRSVLVEPLCPDAACVGYTLALAHGWQARYRDYPAWSDCAYGDLFPRNTSFTFSHLYSFTWAMPIYERYHWTGPWDARRWRGKLLRVDRELTPWRFSVRGAALSEGVWSWAESGYRPTFRPDPAHGRVLEDTPGAWSSLNACWGHAPVVETLPEPQTWSENAWSADRLEPERHDILEIVPCLRGEAVEALNPARPRMAVTSAHTAATRPLYSQGWSGPWDARRWRGHCGYFNLTTLPAQDAPDRVAGA